MGTGKTKQIEGPQNNMDNKKAFEDLILVKQVLDKYNVPFFLAYGTCLGIYRDKKFLPDDDDIDLVITEPVSFKTRKAIGWMLYNLGFQHPEIGFNVFGQMEPAEIGYNGDATTGIIVTEKNVEFSIFFFKEDNCEKHGKEMICVPKLGAVNLIGSPSKFYKKPEKIKFKGVEFMVPGPVEEYLDFTYEDWKDPLKRDHGLTYFEMHPEKIEMVDKISDKNQVFYHVKRD